jgi:HTH-type transcriptional regulator/antitoxin HigA
MEHTTTANFVSDKLSLGEMFEQAAPLVYKYSHNLQKLACACNTAIADEKDLQIRMRLIDELYDCSKSEWDFPAIFAEIVTNRVYEFEQANLDMPEVTQAEALAHFIAENNLKQKDLGEVAGQSVISEILRGKRKMTVEHIKGFARFFCVPEKTFMG